MKKIRIKNKDIVWINSFCTLEYNENIGGFVFESSDGTMMLDSEEVYWDEEEQAYVYDDYSDEVEDELP